MRLKTFFVSLFVVCAVGAGGASSGAATAGGANNLVIVQNTTDGSTADRASARVSYDPADTVANSNIATADSSACDGCTTVAVAMQIVIVESDPSTFIPANVASASNGGCTNCETEAYAFQHIVQPGRNVYLSASAQQQLESLRAAASAIADAPLTFSERDAQLEAVFDQMVTVVDAEMVAAGGGPGVTQVMSRAA